MTLHCLQNKVPTSGYPISFFQTSRIYHADLIFISWGESLHSDAPGSFLLSSLSLESSYLPHFQWSQETTFVKIYLYCSLLCDPLSGVIGMNSVIFLFTSSLSKREEFLLHYFACVLSGLELSVGGLCYVSIPPARYCFGSLFCFWLEACGEELLPLLHLCLLSCRESTCC